MKSLFVGVGTLSFLLAVILTRPGASAVHVQTIIILVLNGFVVIGIAIVLARIDGLISRLDRLRLAAPDAAT